MNSLRLAHKIKRLLESRGYRPTVPQESSREPGASYFWVFRGVTRKTKLTGIRSYEGIVGAVYIFETGDTLLEVPDDDPGLAAELEAAIRP